VHSLLHLTQKSLREKRSDNHEMILQTHWKHWAQKTQDKDKVIQPDRNDNRIIL